MTARVRGDVTGSLWRAQKRATGSSRGPKVGCRVQPAPSHRRCATSLPPSESMIRVHNPSAVRVNDPNRRLSQ